MPIVQRIILVLPQLRDVAASLVAVFLGLGLGGALTRLLDEVEAAAGATKLERKMALARILLEAVAYPTFDANMKALGLDPATARLTLLRIANDLTIEYQNATTPTGAADISQLRAAFTSVADLRSYGEALQLLVVNHGIAPAAVERWIDIVYSPELARLTALEKDVARRIAEASVGEQVGEVPVTPGDRVVEHAPPTPADIAAAGAGVGALGAVALLLTQLQTATQAQTQAIRGSHTDRLGCVASTASRIFGAISGTLLPLGFSTVALSTPATRRVIDDVIGTVWDRIFDTDLVPQPADPETALEAARTLFVEKATLGAGAHLLAVAAEANANLKNMGLGYLAAFLADLAGFNRLAAATMGEVEFAALTLPMRQKAYNDYRPQLPAIVDLGLAYAKKELPPGPIPEGFPPRAGATPTDKDAPHTNLYWALSHQGLSDAWIRMYSHHLFIDPRMAELVRLGQFFNPELDKRSRGATAFMKTWIDARPWLLEQIGIKREEWDEQPWYYFKAAVGGYEPADVRVVVETALRAVVRREQTLMLDATTRLYRDGFIDATRLRELVEEAWGLRPGPDKALTFRGDPVRARIRATEIRTLYEDLADRQDLALRALSRGVATEAEVVAELTALGLPEDRVKRTVLRERLGLLPRTRMATEGPLGAGLTSTSEDGGE